MKRMYLFVVMAMVYGVVVGCSLPFQLAADLAGDMAASALKSSSSSSSSSPELILGQKIEKHQVGKYEIRISDGYLEKKPCIHFALYDNSQLVVAISFEKKDSDDMKMINDFNRMDANGKKQQIRDWFIKYSNFDLGPVEPETSRETAISAPLPNIPTPGFAPTPNLPR